ncbi:hypothetical protein L6164_019759 [Bauhinia variegata]|uniref:Uncharacterized protein n=1 Tax=Bauhinia variegata TaxID=167791 RepID=A0ACB9MUW8_BAUVA|nr:hypothetical protein L6164_019759 [Bauhinia variegata]
MCIASCVAKSVPLEGMGKVKFKSLRELYGRTQEISLPTEPSMFQMEEKLRTSNVCVTQCSTDMHFEQVASIVGGRTGDSTDKASDGKRDSDCPSTHNFVFSSSLRQCSSSADSQEPGGQSCNSPKDMINFDDQRFPAKLEKGKEFEFLGDNISCISKSDSTNLAIGNQNNDAEKKNVSSSLASVDSLPTVGNDVNDKPDRLYLAGYHFDKSNSSHCGIQNFTKESPPTARDPSEFSEEQVVSSLARAVTNGLNSQIEGIYNSATFMKADHQLNFEDSAIETENHSYCEVHLQKSVALVVNNSVREPWQSQLVDPSGVSHLKDDEARVCDICGDVGREHLLAICSKCTDGAEHIYCMRIKLEKVPESDWVCEECLLMTDYGKPKQNTLEETVRISKGCLECQISRNSINHKSSSDGFNFKSSGSTISGTNDRSSTSQLSSKRPASALEVQSVKEARALGMSPVSPMSSKSCTATLFCEDFSCKNLKKGKVEDATSITSALQFSTTSQEKVGNPCACGYKRDAGSSEARSEKKRRILDTTVVSSRASKPIKHSLLNREPQFKNLEDEKMEDVGDVTSLKKNSNILQEKTELHAILRDKLPKLGTHIGLSQDKGSMYEMRSFYSTDLKLKGQQPRVECLQKQKVARNSAFHDDKIEKDSSKKGNANATGSKVCPRKDSHSDAMKKSSHAEELKTAKENDTSELCDPVISSQASDSDVTAVEVEKQAISCKKVIISGPNCHKLDVVESCRKPDYRLKSTSNIMHEDLNCPNEEEINKSWQAECPAEATSDKRTDKVCIDLAFNEMPKLRKLTQFDMTITSATNAIPEDHYIWLGKFQIHSREGLASSFDGIQSHLSTKASPKVLEVVDQFTEILLLEELPRLSIWPSQFVERPVTEDNIALYFFAKDLNSHTTSYTRLLNYMKKNDLALRGNFDGVELVIFSSNVLPENLESWNTSSYLWGVFRGQKVRNSADTTGSNSQRNENRDGGRRWTLDLNVCPPDEEDTVKTLDGGRCLDINPCFNEDDEFDPTGTIYLGHGPLLGGDGSSSGFSDQRQAHPYVGENKSEPEVLDLELSLWPQNAVPGEMEVDTELSVWSQNAVPRETKL